MDSAQMNVEEIMPVQTEKKKKGISGSTVKIIAIIAMLIDHVAAVILARQIMASGYMEAVESGVYEEIMNWLIDNMALYYTYDVMRMIGRLGFPIFCFLLVEGFNRTRNVKKYLARLGIFALISEVPFDLAVAGSPFELGYQNVFFTLFLGLFVLCAFEYFANNELKKIYKWILFGTGALFPATYIAFSLANLVGITEIVTVLIAMVIIALALGVALFVYGKMKGTRRVEILCGDVTVLMLVMYLADLLYTDYSGMGVLTIAVMYLFRKKKVLAMTAGCIVLTIMNISEITAFFALIPIALYNGERGMKMKYFFYAFYPAHLLILYLIAVCMGLGNVAIF